MMYTLSGLDGLDWFDLIAKITRTAVSLNCDVNAITSSNNMRQGFLQSVTSLQLVCCLLLNVLILEYDSVLLPF